MRNALRVLLPNQCSLLYNKLLMEIERKRDAFREQIRKKHIDKLFKKRRLEIAQEMLTQWTNQQEHPVLEETMSSLPASVHVLVTMVHNKGEYVLEQIKQTVPQLISTMAEASLVEWSSYLYILEWVLVSENQGSQARQQLIKACGGLVINKAFRLWEANKMLRAEMMKLYIDFLVCLGHDISLLKNVDIVMITESIRKIFTSLEPQSHEQLFQGIIALSNNVVSIPVSKQNPDQIIRIDELKHMFIVGLLENPTVLKSLIQIGIVAETSDRAQIGLRFFINLTYVVSQPLQISPFVNGLSMLILCYMSQSSFLLSLMGGMLLLRLVNNLIATDLKYAQRLYNEGIIEKMVEFFREESEPLVQKEFISTMSSLVTMMSNEAEVLNQLIRWGCHSMFLQSLALCHSDPEVGEKSLQSVMILQNYQQSQKLYEQLLCYRAELEHLLETSKRQNIINFCEALLSHSNPGHQQIE